MKKLNYITLLLLFGMVLNMEAAFTPEAGVNYFMIQVEQNGTGNQRAVGLSGTNRPAVADADHVNSQMFEFIAVSGQTNTYYIKNAAGQYLNKSTANNWDLVYAAAIDGTNSEWVISGDGPVRLKVNAKAYMASDAVANGSPLYCDKTIDSDRGLFKIIKVSDLYVNHIIDGGFEYSTNGYAPVGIWINDQNSPMGSGYSNGKSKSRVNNAGGHAASGSQYFYLTFRQPADNGYNAISTKIKDLEIGATYQFSFKYTQDGADNDVAQVYAASTANAVVAGAIDEVYTTSLDAKTSVQNGTFSFTAISAESYIVFRNTNGGVSTEFNLYIDDLALVKTADPEPMIMTSVSDISLDAINRVQKFTVTGSLLTNDISVLAPEGVDVYPLTLSADTVDAGIVVSFRGYAASSGNLTLSSGETLVTIPVTVDYAVPSLTQKSLAPAGSGVVAALSAPKNIDADIDVRDLERINLDLLPSEYTIEIKASVNASTGRGLDVEVRNADKTGFRMAVDTADFYDFSVCNQPVALVCEEPGTGFHIYRYAVKDANVDVYIDDLYYTTLALTTGMKPANLVDNGGFELEGLTGWSNPTGWGREITGTRSYSGDKSLNLGAWHGQALVTQYALPVKAGDYEFSFKYIKHSGNNYRWGLAYEQSPAADEDYIAGPWLNLNQAAWTSQSQSFTADADTDLYFSLWEWNNGSAIAIDEVELIPAEGETITPYISFGKAFGKGSANIDVEYVNYDLTGAYAPEKVYTGTSALENKDMLSIYYAGGELVVKHAKKENLKVFTLSGSMVFSAEVDGDMRLHPALEKGVYLAQIGSLITKFVKL